jgi:signal transduction histidine kinase
MTNRPPPSDLAVVHRAGRIAAVQASLALAAVLLVVGGVVYAVDVHVQNQQITSLLTSVVATADDANDPPPGMVLGLRAPSGKLALGDHPAETAKLLAGPAGFSDVRLDGQRYRTLVVDTDRGRVAALLDMQPYEAGRSRLLLSLGIAELAGIVASLAVVVMLTRRSIRPLGQALAIQRRFVADASHELRAPLTVVHTRAQLLARRARSGDTAQAAEQADALVADTRALADVIDDLLESATMTAGGPPRGGVDMSAIANEVRDHMGGLAESAGVGLAVERHGPDDGDFATRGSASALRRAVTALVDNALSHEHPGGRVTIRLARRDTRVVVAVVDDGVGVDPAAVGTLFNRFARGDAETAVGARPRYGIGLALVREIAEAHGGTIEVSETPGGGATFTLVLPGVETAGRHRRPGRRSRS